MEAINSPRNTERDVDSKLELMLVIQPCGRGEREREREDDGVWQNILSLSAYAAKVAERTPARTTHSIYRSRFAVSSNLFPDVSRLAPESRICTKRFLFAEPQAWEEEGEGGEKR